MINGLVKVYDWRKKKTPESDNHNDGQGMILGMLSFWLFLTSRQCRWVHEYLAKMNVIRLMRSWRLITLLILIRLKHPPIIFDERWTLVSLIVRCEVRCPTLIAVKRCSSRGPQLAVHRSSIIFNYLNTRRDEEDLCKTWHHQQATTIFTLTLHSVDRVFSSGLIRKVCSRYIGQRRIPTDVYSTSKCQQSRLRRPEL